MWADEKDRRERAAEAGRRATLRAAWNAFHRASEEATHRSSTITVLASVLGDLVNAGEVTPDLQEIAASRVTGSAELLQAIIDASGPYAAAFGRQLDTCARALRLEHGGDRPEEIVRRMMTIVPEPMREGARGLDGVLVDVLRTPSHATSVPA